MLDFDTVLELMKKYGYSSTSIHPYIYQNGDNIGICYTYIDEDYGVLERIKIFDSLEAFEEFLKEQTWLKSNAKNYNVRMILDNYESSIPKVLYLRNEKVMVEGEMFDIDNFDYRESQRKQMDEVSQILYEAGDLLLVYDEMKDRQLQYLQKVIDLKNTLKGKYYDLQKEVDIYNKYKVERQLTLLPDVIDKGSIDENIERAIKDRYNMYIANRPSLDEIKDFIKQVWDLNLNLELNTKYYEAQKEENDIRNEIKVVDQKLDLMRSLNEVLRPLFGVDLVSKFKKINEICRKESKYMSKDYVAERLNLVNKKYAVYDKLNLYYASDYLREAIQNTNYDDLAIKYSINAKEEDINKGKLPLNEIVSDLTIQYRDRLNTEEQSILVLYNNDKYATIFNVLLEIDNLETLPIKDVLKKLNSIKELSKLKTECYESVKKRIDDPVNSNVKNTLFANVDFTTFETFISSFIKKLVVLKNVNNKMTIKSDFKMYTLVDKVENILKKKYISMTNDLNALLNEAKDKKLMIGICSLKENLPVLYSPYYFDLGDIYSKGASPLMEIKEMANFELLVEVSDTIIFTDENKVEVSRYYTQPKMTENISYVDDIKLGYSTVFCKFSLSSNLPLSEVVASRENVSGPVNDVSQNVINNVDENKEENKPVSNDNDIKKKNVVEEQQVVTAEKPLVKEETPEIKKEVNPPKEEKTEIKPEVKEVTVPVKEEKPEVKKELAPVKAEQNPVSKPKDDLIKTDNKGEKSVAVDKTIPNKSNVVNPSEENKSNVQSSTPPVAKNEPIKEEKVVEKSISTPSTKPLENKAINTNNAVITKKPSVNEVKKEVQKTPSSSANKEPIVTKEVPKTEPVVNLPQKDESKVNSNIELKENIVSKSLNNEVSTTNNGNSVPLKNIVVKSVGSIGKPLNKNDNKGEIK